MLAACPPVLYFSGGVGREGTFGPTLVVASALPRRSFTGHVVCPGHFWSPLVVRKASGPALNSWRGRSDPAEGTSLGGELVLSHPGLGRHLDRVPGRPKRRAVGKVELVHVVDGHVVEDGGGEDVDAF